MNRLTRVIHPQSAVAFGPASELVPDMTIARRPDAAVNGHAEKVEMYALLLTDPDGEAHVFLFDDAGKQRLVQQLAGGIILADRLPPAK